MNALPTSRLAGLRGDGLGSLRALRAAGSLQSHRDALGVFGTVMAPELREDGPLDVVEDGDGIRRVEGGDLEPDLGQAIQRPLGPAELHLQARRNDVVRRQPERW